MFLVRADAPWKGLKEFLDYAKKNPEMITVGNSGAGGGVHLVALAFERRAGVRFNHILFSAGGPSVTAILGGHLNAVSVSPLEGISHVQAGKLKIIALFAERKRNIRNLKQHRSPSDGRRGGSGATGFHNQDLSLVRGR